MESKIYNLIPENKIAENLSDCLRNRSLDQKFFYMKEGGELYYQARNIKSFSKQANFTSEDLIKFWNVRNFDKKESIIFISLGCGKSLIDTTLMKDIIQEGYNIDYLGIDSSYDMLVGAKENMKDLPIKKKFLCADIGSHEFKQKLTELTNQYDRRIFAFFSNTFGNIMYTNIIDILHNLLKKGENIWLDVVLRRGISAKDDMQAAEHMSQYLTTKKDFYFYPLKKVGIPFENGKMVLTTTNEKSVKAIKFQFSFLFTKKTLIAIDKEEIIMLPNEKINLMQIFAYDHDGLISFFKEHGFKFLYKKKKEQKGHFFFEKD